MKKVSDSLINFFGLVKRVFYSLINFFGLMKRDQHFMAAISSISHHIIWKRQRFSSVPKYSDFNEFMIQLPKEIQTFKTDIFWKSTLASELQAPSGSASLTTLDLKAWKVSGWEVYLKASGGWQPSIDGGLGLATEP